MEHVHLAGEDEDDIYSGYNEYNATLDTDDLENDPGFQQAVRTSHGRRPPIAGRMPAAGMRLGTTMKGRNAMPSSMGRVVTAAPQDGQNRPMTAVRAAGFSSAGRGKFIIQYIPLIDIFSHQASLTRQAFLIAPLHFSHSKMGKKWIH